MECNLYEGGMQIITAKNEAAKNNAGQKQKSVLDSECPMQKNRQSKDLIVPNSAGSSVNQSAGKLC